MVGVGIIQLFFFSIILTIAPLCNSFSFTYDFSNPTTFNPTDFHAEGAAAINGGVIDLTTANTHDIQGRWSYNRSPVTLWNDATGEVASFNTCFTFAIVPPADGSPRGDGMAFFLAHYPSNLNFTAVGGNLGLIPAGAMSGNGDARIVGIEFDTFNNTWDPSGAIDHIGVDLNDLHSVNYTALPAGELEGDMSACIDYSGVEHILSVTLVGKNNISYHLSASFDFRTVLASPEVAVGFCAATGGGGSELHQINTWSFSSTLEPAMAAPASRGTSDGSRREVALMREDTIVALGAVAVGGLGVILVLQICIVLLLIHWNKKTKLVSYEKDEK